MREGVRIGDISDALLEEIGSNLQHYFVPILGVAEERTRDPARLIGSGTLVKIDTAYYILTAAHVWEDAPKAFSAIGLALTSYVSKLSIPRQYIVARTLRGSECEEYGPDLALLAIPVPFISQIREHKIFLNLSRQRKDFLTHASGLDSGVWAVTGAVDELSSLREDLGRKIVKVDVQGRALFGIIEGIHEEDGYDYLDVGADMELPAVPQSFGGVSGGGLWRIALSKGKMGQILWSEKKYFQGVAFWQSEIRRRRRVVRCHGRKSVFEKAWKEWGLPN